MPNSPISQAAEIMALRLEIKKLEHIAETLTHCINYSKDKDELNFIYLRCVLSQSYNRDFLETYNTILNEY